MVIVSPARKRKHARRSLEVVSPSALPPIMEYSGSDEERAQPAPNTNEGAQSNTSTHEDGREPVGESTGVVNFPQKDSVDFLQPESNPFGSYVLAMHKPKLQFVDVTAGEPLSPRNACNTFEQSGAPSYLVTNDSSGDDTAPGSGAIVPAVPTNGTTPHVSSQLLNHPIANHLKGNPKSLEEALDHLLATLPSPQRLRWLSTSAHHVAMPEISVGEQCNSPAKETSSLGHPLPVPPTPSDHLDKRARKAAKAAKKAEKKLKRLAADPAVSPAHSQMEAVEAAEKEKKLTADRKKQEAAAKAELQREAEATQWIQKLVAQRQALLGFLTASPSSSRAHGVVAVRIPNLQQQGLGVR